MKSGMLAAEAIFPKVTAESADSETAGTAFKTPSKVTKVARELKLFKVSATRLRRTGLNVRLHDWSAVKRSVGKLFHGFSEMDTQTAGLYIRGNKNVSSENYLSADFQKRDTAVSDWT